MPRVYRLPRYVAKYFDEQANEATKALASVSPRQKEIIRESILENADELVKSELWRAIQYDVLNSGKDAFKYPESDKPDK